MPSASPPDPDACYRALCAKDARFDGRFFTGVLSTGIYCRPVCRVRTPLRVNCRFFEWAAQAEQAGFRPCLRCRPELAPGPARWSRQDAGSALLSQAMAWMDRPDSHSFEGLAQVADRLGVSERHLRRLFEQHLGLSPLQYLQTRRLLCAKQLLSDTRMPVSDIAAACGFGSLRRFHAAFAERYRLNPLALRRQANPADGHPAGGRQTKASVKPTPALVAPTALGPSGKQALGPVVRLGYRPPMDTPGLMSHLARRAVSGVEAGGLGAEALVWRRTLAVDTPQGRHAGALALRWVPERHEVWLQVDAGLEPVLPEVIRRCRAAFDLEADTEAIDAHLLALGLPGPPGARIAGCFDGFELAVRAVLGQQVSLAQATRLAQRVAEVFGRPVATAWPDLNRVFPSAQDLVDAGPELAQRLGELGVLRSRQTALHALAQAQAAGTLDLNQRQGLGLHEHLARLRALPGIGPWTADYIALRALGGVDVWPRGDAVLRHHQHPADPSMSRCAPWRGYAAMRVWQHAPTRPHQPSHARSEP